MIIYFNIAAIVFCVYVFIVRYMDKFEEDNTLLACFLLGLFWPISLTRLLGMLVVKIKKENKR